jgi:hypothetical protein
MKARLTGVEVDGTGQSAAWSTTRRWRRLARRRAWRRHVGGTGGRRCKRVERRGGRGPALRGLGRRGGGLGRRGGPGAPLRWGGTTGAALRGAARRAGQRDGAGAVRRGEGRRGSASGGAVGRATAAHERPGRAAAKKFGGEKKQNREEGTGYF